MGILPIELISLAAKLRALLTMGARTDRAGVILRIPLEGIQHLLGLKGVLQHATVATKIPFLGILTFIVLVLSLLIIL